VPHFYDENDEDEGVGEFEEDVDGFGDESEGEGFLDVLDGSV
jgi:hypothetical protein